MFFCAQGLRSAQIARFIPLTRRGKVHTIMHRMRQKTEEKQEMDYRLLVINPGSTSTKISLFVNEKEIFEKSQFHDAPLLLQ